MICVGGKLRHTNIAEAKYPIILPYNYRVTNLILKEEHLRLLHCGQEQPLASIRQKYWILSGRRAVRKITRSCLNCFCIHSEDAAVKMGDLPKDRVTGFVKPFAISGVDYAGPLLLVKESKR